MPDPSTREEIRAEVIEVLARAGYDPGYGQWDTAGENVRANWRHSMARYVDALDEAGLLVTAVEGRFIGRGMLRRTRYVTDWREPEEGGR